MKKAMLLLSIFSFAVAQEVKKKQELAPADRSLQLRSKYDERLKALQITPTSQRSILNFSLIVDTSFVARNKNEPRVQALGDPRAISQARRQQTRTRNPKRKERL